MEKKTKDKLNQTQAIKMFVNKGNFGKKFYVWPGLDKTGMNLIKLMKYKIGIWCSLFVK